MNYNFMDELFILESLTNINIFKKKNEDLGKIKECKLRDSNRIIKDCHKMKQKKILNLSHDLKTMSGGAITIDKIKTIHEKTVHDIDNLDKIIDIMNYNFVSCNEFIEVYSN